LSGKIYPPHIAKQARKTKQKSGLRTGGNKLKISYQKTQAKLSKKIQANLSDKMIELAWLGLAIF
jgi:hypothetical protein